MSKGPCTAFSDQLWEKYAVFDVVYITTALHCVPHANLQQVSEERIKYSKWLEQTLIRYRCVSCCVTQHHHLPATAHPQLTIVPLPKCLPPCYFQVMLSALRPPELLHLRFQQYFEHCIRDKRPPPKNLGCAAIYNWQTHGLRDLTGHQVKLHPDFFQNTSLVDTLAEILEAPEFASNAADFLRNPNGTHSWLRAVIDVNAQSRVFVTSRLAPMHKYKWVCQQLLLGKPFDDEEFLLRSVDASAFLQEVGTLNPTDPMESLRKFVLEDLVFWPIPFTTFWRTLRSSYDALQSMCDRATTDFYDLNYAVTEEQMDKEHDTLYAAFTKIVNDSHNDMLQGVPEWRRDDEQSAESWEEQQQCYALLKVCPLLETTSTPTTHVPRQTVHPHRFPVPSPPPMRHTSTLCPSQDRLDVITGCAVSTEDLPCIRPVYVSGPPGCGKTHLLLHTMRELHKQLPLCARLASSCCCP